MDGIMCPAHSHTSEPGRRIADYGEMATRDHGGFFRNHGLSVMMLGCLFPFFLGGQVVSGMHEYNDERQKHGQAEVRLGEYLRSANFI